MAGTRGQWNTRFGFIMAAVGSAVGLGNLVRFPRELAANGGAAYLIVYLVLLVLVGLPAILGEMSLGKMAQLSPIQAYRKLAQRGKGVWPIVGVFSMLAAVFVLFFYVVMTGWTLRFTVEGFLGGWWGSDQASTFYDSVAYGPAAIFWHGVVVALMIFILGRGVSNGIERVVTIMMPVLFTIVVGIIVYALFQPGFGAGYAAVFKPDFSELTPNSAARAAGQVFFSLSLGQGAMLTYASYMEKRQSVMKDGTITAAADSGVAILAAMMIFPILAFTGLLMDPGMQAELASGNFGTAFKAMPSAFVTMGPIGRVVGTAFFAALFFAAFSSAISLLEVPTSILVDGKGMPRWKAALTMGLVVYTFGVVSALNEHWFELYDEIAVNIFIVSGVALTTLFAGWVVPGVAKELDRGLRSRLGVYAVWMMRTVAPFLIVGVFIFGGLWGTDAGGSIDFWAADADHACGNIPRGECKADAAGWRHLFELLKEALGIH